MEREDGEMSDDNDMLVDEYMTENNVDNATSTMLYKTEKNGLVIKKLEKVDAIKLEERARRFGLDLTGNRVITQKQIDDLYQHFGIESENERHFRFDSIHLNGVDGLTTKEIFQYLEDYKPLSLEWIDNISCNVVCQDHISAALALLAHSQEIQNEDLNRRLAKKSDHHWRVGIPHPRKDLILMRFATNGDKKIVKKKQDSKSYPVYYDNEFDSVSKNPWGDLCKSWGVYDHQEVFESKYTKHDYEDVIEEPEIIVPIKNKKLAMRLGKRPHNVNQSNDMDDDSSSDSEWKTKSKTPRMRMHADDEEKKQKMKNVSKLPKDEYTEKFAPLSIEVINNQKNYSHREMTKLSDKFKYHKTEKCQSIQSRLGEKIIPEDDAWSSDDSSINIDYNITSKVQKVQTKSNDNNSIWSRLEVVPSSTGGGGGGSDLRQIIKSKKEKKLDDLRERIGNTKQTNLRIEIDNK